MLSRQCRGIHLLRPERRSRAVSENRTGNAATAQADISIRLTGIGRQNADKLLTRFYW
jgi:hypothetical protein